MPRTHGCVNSEKDRIYRIWYPDALQQASQAAASPRAEKNEASNDGPRAAAVRKTSFDAFPSMPMQQQLPNERKFLASPRVGSARLGSSNLSPRASVQQSAGAASAYAPAYTVHPASAPFMARPLSARSSASAASSVPPVLGSTFSRPSSACGSNSQQPQTQNHGRDAGGDGSARAKVMADGGSDGALRERHEATRASSASRHILARSQRLAHDGPTFSKLSAPPSPRPPRPPLEARGM